MSKCINLSTNGRKRGHVYDGNKCVHCGHITKHGANFERVSQLDNGKEVK